MENRYKISYDIKSYNILDVKFKQGDTDSSVIEINLFDGGQVVDVTGEAIEFRFLKPDKTSVFQDATSGVKVLDAVNGAFECTLKANTLAVPGLVFAEVVRTKDGIILTSPAFNLLVEKSIGSMALSTNYIASIENKIVEWQLKENIRQSTFEINENSRISKSDAKIADVESRFQAMAASQQGATEVIDARKGKASLRAKIDEMDTQSNEIASDFKIISMQGASFVDKMQGLIDVRGIYVKTDTEGKGIDVGICLENTENTVVKYQFRYNGDNVLLLKGVSTGKQVIDIAPTIEFNGTFNKKSPPNVYTTTIGDTFSFEFTGDMLSFMRYTESGGGVWEFVLNTGQKRIISCYNGVGKTVEDTIFENLPYGKYTCVATFKGDDPQNPPSSTPSRGYITLYPNKLTSYTGKTLSKKISIMDEQTSKMLISQNSIPDFAISAKPNNTSYKSEWVPMHGSVGGVSLSPHIKVEADGIELINVAGVLPKDEFYYNVGSISINQSFLATNPNGTDGNMWKHFVSHTISKRFPLLVINNRLEILQDTIIGNMYLTMLPVHSDNVSRLVLNNGVEYNSIPRDSSSIPLDMDVSSVMFAGETSLGRYHACAIDIGSYGEAIGVRHNHNSNPIGLLTFRADNVAKFYLNAFSGVVTKGTVFKNTQRIACVSGIKYPNELLKSL